MQKESYDFNVFHVEEAAGSSYIPDQEEFVAPYGIQSILGFGSLLPTGHLYAVIVFSKVGISRETANLFRAIALGVRMAFGREHPGAAGTARVEPGTGCYRRGFVGRDSGITAQRGALAAPNAGARYGAGRFVFCGAFAGCRWGGKYLFDGGGVGGMMTPEQRYAFDLTGYLHLKNVLSGEDLERAQRAAERYVQTPVEELPPGFAAEAGNYAHGFAFDKALEVLTRHPITWPIIRELTNDKPQFVSGSLRVNTHEDNRFFELHSRREEDNCIEWPRYFCRDGRIYCDDLAFFFYLSDVMPGDGGLVVVPGSHKSEFKRPDDFYLPAAEGAEPQPHPAVANIAPRAGDVVVISEMLTHGALIRKPTDRDRRFLILRYRPQHMLPLNEFPPEIKARLSPETLDLIATVPYYQVKEIVGRDAGSADLT